MFFIISFYFLLLFFLDCFFPCGVMGRGCWSLEISVCNFFSFFLFFNLGFNNRKRTFNHVRWPVSLSLSCHVKVGCPAGLKANIKLTVNRFILQLSLGRFHCGGASSLDPRSIDFQGGFC